MSKNASWEKQFPVGATVQLVSGGPTMTVEEHNFNGKIECQWFSGKKLERGFFAPETLISVKNEGQAKDS